MDYRENNRSGQNRPSDHPEQDTPKQSLLTEGKKHDERYRPRGDRRYRPELMTHNDDGATERHDPPALRQRVVSPCKTDGGGERHHPPVAGLLPYDKQDQGCRNSRILQSTVNVDVSITRGLKGL